VAVHLDLQGHDKEASARRAVLFEFIKFCVHVYSRLRGADYVRKILGRTTKKKAGLASAPLRVGVALGAKTYNKMLARMDNMEVIVETADHAPGEVAEEAAGLSDESSSGDDDEQEHGSMYEDDYEAFGA